MGHTDIVIRGAREHNLRGIDVTLPRESLITVTGVSGSGKSSLAFDTLFREGQRRFLESLSSYARQFVGRLERPKVESVTGLSPTISIDQKTVNRNPRSTVGTITELADFLRLLYARLGTPHCATCDRVLEARTVDQMTEHVLQVAEGQRCVVLAPIVRDRKGHYRKELEGWRQRGFVRARIDGTVVRLDEPIQLARYQRHTIELVVDRMRVDAAKRGRLAEALEQAVRLSESTAAVLLGEDDWREFSTRLACPTCATSLPELEPRLFSFNSPHGACAECDGLGERRRVDPGKVVPDPSLSLADGAFAVTTKTGYLPYVKLREDGLRQLGSQWGFDVEVPWRTLTKAVRKKLLYGSDETIRIEFAHESTTGKYSVEGVDERAYAGLIPAMQEAWERGHPRHLEKYLSVLPCAACEGTRLRPEARAVRFRERPITAYASETLDGLGVFFDALTLSEREATLGTAIIREMRTRLEFLRRVGLGYLSLGRTAASLSGGEAQRVRLATQVGAGLQGVLYVLDEPSIGLHPRDNGRLIGTLEALRDRRNTVVVVEHDADTMRHSDWIVDIGPGAGSRGGHLVVDGPLEEVLEHPSSTTARYLRGEVRMPIPEARRAGNGLALTLKGVRQFNLQNLNATFPLGMFLGVTGVSGSGKSTLVHRVLRRALSKALHRAEAVPGDHRALEGIEHLDKVIEIDQSPIGRTPRSNPATYTKAWDSIRDLFASTVEAKARGYSKSRFSFNVAGGRCEACQGAGVRTIQMQFLADVEVPCEGCDGRRFNRETREIRFAGVSVDEVLAMTVADALTVFEHVPRLHRILQTLVDVGLDYVALGQPSSTLSGGEAQRVKLASELARPADGRTLYILDEPTTGLHFDDTRKLVETLQRLVDQGQSVLVIEHNLDVIGSCDHLLELGPDGGLGGGRLIASGTPEQVAKVKESPTAPFLRAWLKPPKVVKARKSRPSARRAPPAKTRRLSVRGASKHNLQHVDLDVPHDQLTVITGVSGSGKTSLAFDTLFAEGQRRFVESLSTYARRFFSRLDRAPVESIEGIRPAIAIDQKAGVRNPRSTVATSTEVYDSLRLLFGRMGTPHCPSCDRELGVFQATTAAVRELEEHDGERLLICAPLFRADATRPLAFAAAEELRQAAAPLRAEGFVRVVLDGVERRLDEAVSALHADVQAIDLVFDRLKASSRHRSRIAEAFESAFRRGHGLAVVHAGEAVREYSTRLSCEPCGVVFEEVLTPRHFSFNHHLGACPTCEGLGRSRRAVEEAVIERPDRPLSKDALHESVRGAFAKKGAFLRGVMDAAAVALKADLDKPFSKLTRRQREGLLRGTGVPETVEASLQRGKGGSTRAYTFAAPWRGILGEIDHWLRGAEEGKSQLAKLDPVTAEGACAACRGARLRPEARAVRFGGRRLDEVTAMSVAEAREWFDALILPKSLKAIAAQPLTEVGGRLRFLDDVGLGYVTLDRGSATLSGGEAQRIRLAQQLGSGLVGVLYVLDEPSIGLHPRDTERLLKSLRGLRDLGNTVVVVEHDEDVIRAADYLVDLGPGAGHHGGRIVAEGTVASVEKDRRSPTGAFLRGERRIEVPPHRRTTEGTVTVRGARHHNLKEVDASFELGTLTAVTGVSGSGKSSLVMDVLRPAMETHLAGESLPRGRLTALEGADAIGQLVLIDQSPIGTTPASNPATYTKVFDPIRDVFASSPDAKVRGFGKGRFSFNQGAGRCEACQGRGALLVEMHFLSDVWVTCEACRGRRYNHETLTVRVKDKTIADVLDLEVRDALEFFSTVPRIRRVLKVLDDVGLGYVRLGQSSTTLSGGEAQRVKLAAELARPARGHALYLLDEPTTGLHFSDVEKLVQVFHRLVEKGNTLVVIEHQLDVIANADRVLDLGPEGGEGGGRLCVQGTPEQVAAHPDSATGAALRRLAGWRAPSRANA